LSAFEIDLIPGLISKFELFDRELKHEEDFFGIKSLSDFENKYTAKDVLALPKPEKRKDILEMSIKYIKEDNGSRLTELSEEIDDKLDVEEIQPTVIRDSRKSNSYTLTLARIYEEQGAVKDAIEIYKKLIEQNPKERDYYESRIKQLS
jgi:tetratricopeptide (TPR) repeat protein